MIDAARTTPPAAWPPDQMRGKSRWIRVSRHRVCPICGRPDWCLVCEDGSAAICARVDSSRRVGEAGWLHILRRDYQPRPVRRAFHVASSARINFATLADRYRARLTPAALAGLSQQLAVSAESLRRLGVGWNGAGFTFPMRNPSGQIIGIRVRFPSSAKAAVPGSRQGLFIPCGLPIDGPLLICEGPTDTGAALDLGCAVIGRPSCTGGMTMAVTISRGREVVIVGDNDTPGRRGAESLATVLTPYCRTVRTIYPPDGIKDLRQWRRAGMTTKEFCDVVEKVQPRRLVISARRLARSGKEERCGQ